VTPLVSVGIPSYNHAPFLAAAIESVLEQSVRDLELVVADDGSRDGSFEIAQRYAEADPRVAVVTHPGHANRGIGATVNLYRREVGGRYHVGMGSDDVLFPGALERQVAYLEAHPRLGYVYGYARPIDADGRELADARLVGEDLTVGGRTVERLVQGNKIPVMALMMRRECLEQAGPEDEQLLYSDWEFFTRAAAHWDVAFIPDCLAGQRVHGRNVSVGASRAANLERALAVTQAFRERAPLVGGRLGEPRPRATIELQLAFLRFADGDASAGGAHLPQALERDPSLAADGRWLGDWLWSRLLDGLLPDDRGWSFVEWIEGEIAPSLDAGAARVFRRAAAASRREARAIHLARARRPTRAHSAALAAFAISPRRAADRRFAAILLDSIADGEAGNWLRRRRRELLGLP
jgi:GT2 family glycosyltransferase